MIAQRLVRLIETHADELASGVMRRLEASEQASEMRKVPAEELKLRVYEIYSNLSDWLLTRTQEAIENRYTRIGARRAAQGIALSHLLYAITTVKKKHCELLRYEGIVDRHVELFQELELLRMVDLFFDRAIYFAAQGYESAVKVRAAA